MRIFRHGAALDLASWMSLALCAVAVAVGIGWIAEDRLRGRPDPSRSMWGAALAAAGVVLVFRFQGDFRYLWNCC